MVIRVPDREEQKQIEEIWTKHCKLHENHKSTGPRNSTKHK